RDGRLRHASTLGGGADRCTASQRQQQPLVAPLKPAVFVFLCLHFQSTSHQSTPVVTCSSRRLANNRLPSAVGVTVFIFSPLSNSPPRTRAEDGVTQINSFFALLAAV